MGFLRSLAVAERELCPEERDTLEDPANNFEVKKGINVMVQQVPEAL